MTGLEMQAIQVHAYGGPEQLVLEKVPRPAPQAGQVLLRVLAAGVNPVDWKMRSGASRAYTQLQFPWIPGRDGAGVIEALGEGVSSYQPGQPVYGVFNGSYAEYALAQPGDLGLTPENIDADHAAATPIGALTAWKSLFEVAGIQAGQRVLIQGAAGGVGSFAVQLAHWKGARVIGTASAKNLEFVNSLGAEQVIDYRAAPFETILQNVDVVLDTVGGEVTQRSLHVLHKGGLLVTIAGQVPEEEASRLEVRAVRGGRASADVLPQISALITEGLIYPVVEAVFPLAEAGKAQAQSETGHGRGRIVLHV